MFASKRYDRWCVFVFFLSVACGKQFESLIDIPSVVFSCANDRDLFKPILPDIPDP